MRLVFLIVAFAVGAFAGNLPKHPKDPADFFKKFEPGREKDPYSPTLMSPYADDVEAADPRAVLGE